MNVSVFCLRYSTWLWSSGTSFGDVEFDDKFHHHDWQCTGTQDFFHEDNDGDVRCYLADFGNTLLPAPKTIRWTRELGTCCVAKATLSDGDLDTMEDRENKATLPIQSSLLQSCEEGSWKTEKISTEKRL